ncbi:MAG: hydroxymethylglutaryl-CoA synthase family protein [Promethearchaeota archaeon]
MPQSSQADLFSEIGIDSIGFYAPTYYVSLKELAQARNIKPEKFEEGLMVQEMRVPDVGEDIVTMSIKAAQNALIRGNIKAEEIDAVFVGTETITYAVKSISNILAEILGVSPNCLTQDIYNACAGATLAILNAIGLIENGVIQKALVIGADISSYPLNSPGEPTQGAGSVAFILSRNPRIATFSKKFGKVSGNVNDFFRPAGEKDAQVFGKYSVDSYMNFQLRAFDNLSQNLGKFRADYYVFHAPFSKLPVKFLQKLIAERSEHFIEHALNWKFKPPRSRLSSQLPSIRYSVKHFPSLITNILLKHGFSRQAIIKLLKTASELKHYFFPQLEVPMHFGNMYSASVWAQIIYLFEKSARPNDIFYFGSYGSGATCISGLIKIQPQIFQVVNIGPKIDHFLHNKKKYSIKEYERIHMGLGTPNFYIGRIEKYSADDNRGIYLHFCDEGCLIPNISGLNQCPQGHPGNHRVFYPLYAKLVSDLVEEPQKRNYTFINHGQVRIIGKPQKGAKLEYNMRRVSAPMDQISAKGLLNWIPTYQPADFD